jgi:hypothetical protein
VKYFFVRYAVVNLINPGREAKVQVGTDSHTLLSSKRARASFGSIMKLQRANCPKMVNIIWNYEANSPEP